MEGHMEIAIGILSSIVSAVTAAIFVYEFKEHDSSHRERETRRQEEYDALKDGMQAILRDRIIFLCEENESIGYCPIPTTENIGMMYAAYHKLGGERHSYAAIRRSEIHAAYTEERRINMKERFLAAADWAQKNWLALVIAMIVLMLIFVCAVMCSWLYGYWSNALSGTSLVQEV